MNRIHIRVTMKIFMDAILSELNQHEIDYSVHDDTLIQLAESDFNSCMKWLGKLPGWKQETRGSKPA